MKKYLCVLLFSIIGVFANAQAFDDLPYSNPDWATYFQQEMKSLMKFQVANDMNVPFFIGFSGSGTGGLYYKNDYLKSLYSAYPDYYNWNVSDNDDLGAFQNKSNGYMNLILGGQIKINKALYIPMLFSWGYLAFSDHIEEYEYLYNGTPYKTPVRLDHFTHTVFAGSGVFINTNLIKGGIYMGWRWNGGKDGTVTSPIFYKIGEGDKYVEGNDTSAHKFNIALVPLIPTSEWAIVGKVLESILGYFGLGDVVMNMEEDKGDTKAAAFASAINAALDFSFNKINWGPLSLNTQVFYTRGNFDAVAKNDVYGAKVTGLFSFPLGFTLEGGYKHFYSVSKFFTQDYPDTGYFNGSIFFPFKHITFGFIYGYDAIYKSKFTIALTTNYLSGLITLFDKERFKDKTKFGEDAQNPLGHLNDNLFELGARFRWGGWKVGK